jgi:hypothetical protein
MQRTNLNRFILGLLVIVIAGCASTKGGSPDTTSAPERASADAFAAEALGTYHVQRDGARTLMLMAAAVKQAPNRADIAYLQIALCRQIEGCGAAPFEARLRKLDPGNAVVWLRALADAQRQRDVAVEAQVLDAIGRAERFDVYWPSLVAGITSVRHPGGTGLEAALNETIGWLAGTAVPSLQPLTAACSRVRMSEAAWAERCRRAARVLMRGDTYIVESFGLAIAKQGAVADPVELAKLDERARTSRYLWRTSAEIITSQVERDKFAAEHLKLMRMVKREQDVHSAITRWAGRPTTPPPDFRMDE